MNLLVSPPAAYDDFLCSAIIAAEQVPAGRTMYEVVFGFDADELRAFLKHALCAGLEGSPLSRRAFHLLLDNGRPVACCAAWVEGQGGSASGVGVALLVSQFLGMPRFRERAAAIRSLSAAAPRRTEGTLQMESFFVLPEYRGHGLVRHLVNSAASQATLTLSAQRAEIALLRENAEAAAAYRAAGFAESPLERHADALFAQLTGSAGFLKLTRGLLPDTRSNS